MDTCNSKIEGGDELTAVKDKQTNTCNSKNEGGDELTAVKRRTNEQLFGTDTHSQPTTRTILAF
jgi:hypothetical protein